MISALSAATRIACRQMTPQHLDALHAGVELASGLSARPDWRPKAAAHAAREEQHLKCLHFVGRLAGGASSAGIPRAS